MYRKSIYKYVLKYNCLYNHIFKIMVLNKTLLKYISRQNHSLFYLNVHSTKHSYEKYILFVSCEYRFSCIIYKFKFIKLFC